MNRWIQKITGILLLGSILASGCGSRSEAIFDGSMTGNDKSFYMEFKTLNTEYTHDFDLVEGDELAVNIVKNSGRISVKIQREDKDPVYRGDDADSGSFTVGIPVDGTYTVSVSGKNGEGSVSIEVK